MLHYHQKRKNAIEYCGMLWGQNLYGCCNGKKVYFGIFGFSVLKPQAVLLSLSLELAVSATIVRVTLRHLWNNDRTCVLDSLFNSFTCGVLKHIWVMNIVNYFSGIDETVIKHAFVLWWLHTWNFANTRLCFFATCVFPCEANFQQPLPL